MHQTIRHALLGSASALLLAPAALAQEAAQNPPAAAPSGLLEEIVVTAVPAAGTKLETSVSVSSLSVAQMQNYAPRSTAELFRNIPGIRSESSGGGGNANIAVRGLPISTGGAKFLSLQEDGLPVLQFGDIAFGNADNFLRADTSILRVEAIRGGSASTFATNSPGGVINLISKTGEVEGGSVGITRGVDFDTTQLDFEYGGPIADDWAFHVGGFYRVGEGPREAGYDGDNGGQIKANLTKNFENGYARLYFKHLNDRAITYLPMPLLATGTNKSPGFLSVPGFDAKSDTPHTPFLLTNFGIGGDGNLRSRDVRDGIRAITTAVGFEFSYDLADDWNIQTRMRYADNKGGFVSPFPASIAAATTIAEGIGGPGATLGYANGPNGGGAIANPAALNGNGLAMSVALFDVDVNDFSNFANDLKVAKSFSLDGGSYLDITFGYYKGIQSIDMDWVWNSYVMEVKGKNGALLDVFDADGTLLTQNGLFQYGDPFGGCCQRSYDTKYDTDAPYVSLYWEKDRLNIDASIRFTFISASGNYAGTIRAPFDANRDGAITGPEGNVSFIDNANQKPVDYTADYLSYSLGGNYLVTDDMAVFARYSRGGSSNADRLLFGPAIAADGSLTDENAAVDIVRQLESGVKYRNGALNLFGTFFYAKTEENNFEVTRLTFVDRKYRAYGVELEAAYQIGAFDFTAGLTWTDAEITKDVIDPTLEGNTPRRQADFIYQLTPSYSGHGFTIGANVVGTTSAYAQFNNQLKMPGYAQVNLFANAEVTEGLVLSFNANNLFNTLGVTEIEEGAIVANADTILRARAINGRTMSISLRYAF
ncbi:MAG: TonB-dependent receptor domain-containing protein [Pseudomonadota bacterium]